MSPPSPRFIIGVMITAVTLCRLPWWRQNMRLSNVLFVLIKGRGRGSRGTLGAILPAHRASGWSTTAVWLVRRREQRAAEQLSLLLSPRLRAFSPRVAPFLPSFCLIIVPFTVSLPPVPSVSLYLSLNRLFFFSFNSLTSRAIILLLLFLLQIQGEKKGKSQRG